MPCSQYYETLTSVSNCGIGRKHIQRVKIPYKVACFTWLVVKEAALNQDNPRKRGISICSRCYFCGQEAETISHPFLYCKVTSHLWDLFSTSGILDGQCQDEQLTFYHVGMMKGKNTTNKARWNIVPAAI